MLTKLDADPVERLPRGDAGEVSRRSRLSGVWFWWVLATTSGGAAGLVAGRLIANLYDASYDVRSTIPYGYQVGWVIYWLDFGAGILACSAIWTAVGFAQWLVLRSERLRLGPWMLATFLEDSGRSCLHVRAFTC